MKVTIDIPASIIDAAYGMLAYKCADGQEEMEKLKEAAKSIQESEEPVELDLTRFDGDPKDIQIALAICLIATKLQ